MVLEHEARRPKTGALQGMVVVLGILAGLTLWMVATSWLMRWVGGSIATVIFWLGGAAVAWWAMNRYVMFFHYETSGALLRVTHRYGKYERPFAEVYFTKLVDAGEPDALRAKYPNARRQNAVKKGCADEVFGVVYRFDGRLMLLTLQPSAAMRDVIADHVPAKKK